MKHYFKEVDQNRKNRAIRRVWEVSANSLNEAWNIIEEHGIQAEVGYKRMVIRITTKFAKEQLGFEKRVKL